MNCYDTCNLLLSCAQMLIWNHQDVVLPSLIYSFAVLRFGEERINSVLVILIRVWIQCCVWCMCLFYFSPLVLYFASVNFDVCFTLSFCVFSPIVLRVVICIVWISEDRSRSASAPTLGIVVLHVCLYQCSAVIAANSWLWPWTFKTELETRSLLKH